MKWPREVTHIVILPKGKKDGAIQPVSIEDWNTEIKNALGASVTRIGKTATFNLADLPPGEFDIVMVGGLRVTIKCKGPCEVGRMESLVRAARLDQEPHPHRYGTHRRQPDDPRRCPRPRAVRGQGGRATCRPAAAGPTPPREPRGRLSGSPPPDRPGDRSRVGWLALSPRTGHVPP